MHFGGKKGYCISLSRKLVEINNESQVLDTILHEIAHAMDYEERGDTDHGTNWKRIAIEIGCNGERCYDLSEVKQPKMKYTTECGNCGNTNGKMRNNGKKSHVFVTDGSSEVLEIPHKNIADKMVEVFNDNTDSGCSYKVITIGGK